MTGFFIVHCYFIENNFPRAVDHRPKGPGWGAVGVTLLHTVTVYAGLSGFISEKAGIVACGISPGIIVGQAKVSTVLRMHHILILLDFRGQHQHTYHKLLPAFCSS